MEVRQLGGRDHHRSDARRAQLPRHRRYAHRGRPGRDLGVLIAYQGEEYVGRYEGGGQLAVEINAYYQAVLSGMDLRQVYLPAIETAGAVTTA
jgi:hypothetical protein